MNAASETNQQNQWKQNLIEDLLPIDFLGVLSCILLLGIGVLYLAGLVKDFNKR